ncbi:hypothetical protein [Neobacillus mesonae]|uniref:Uncharacterized protein n=1 Tax=Neobacillus mesonae TaxID=1193713 RepID=A0A3Q9R006_9BACI|nr:hypothetical protein [Neobacillus mesonae]AZU62905.1 hypothetical protein CHR53_17515 [Neobacillus mesonae]
MAKSKKAKWLMGISGTALSAFVISQVGANQGSTPLDLPQTISADSVSKQEKALIKLDWTNYNINGAAPSKGVEQSDRQTRRS